MNKYSQLCACQPPGFGGIERVAQELALHLQDKQLYKCTYYFKRDTSLKGAGSIKYPPARRLILSNLPLPDFKALLRLLRSNDTTIFHLPSLSVLIIAILHSIITPRAKRYVYWHAFLGYPDDPILGLLAHLYEKFVFSFCAATKTAIITTSPILKNEIEAQRDHLCVHTVCPVLPCGADDRLEVHMKTQSSIAQARKTYQLCFVGRLATYKRPEWLIDALKMLPNNIVLDIVGDGPCRTSLEKRVKDSGLEDRITFHGRTDENTKLRIIGTADILCLPSYSCNEAFGIVQLEAMCMGVPPLAFSLPRSGVEWVGNIKSLLPFEKIDKKNINEVIMHLYESPSLLRQLSSYSLARYRDLFCREAWEKSLKFLVTDL